MFNIMKAQQYQIRKDNTTYYYLIGGLAIGILSIAFVMSDNGFSDLTGSVWFGSMAYGNIILLNVMAMLFTSRICGWDFQDKTLNYEVLNGAKRSDIFFGRYFLSLIWTFASAYGVLLLTMAGVTLINGWGVMLPFKAALFRTAMFAFPLFRLVALYTLMTFLCMDGRPVIVIGFILQQVEILMTMLGEELSFSTKAFDYLFSLLCINKLADVGNMTFDYIDGKDVMVIKDTLTMTDSLTCGAVCLAVGILYLIIGYAVFKKRDLK